MRILRHTHSQSAVRALPPGLSGLLCASGDVVQTIAATAGVHAATGVLWHAERLAGKGVAAGEGAVVMELFDDRWTEALHVAEMFRRTTGYILLDIHPGNIAFGD